VKLSDVRHQPRALAIIQRALRSGRTPHAYLFHGPSGVGKELAARALAARLLCDADTARPEADACGVCRSCELCARQAHPDLHLVERGLHRFHPDPTVRARRGLFLSVDVVRQFLVQPAVAAPALGRRRVFIVRDAEQMNEQAQNALLKTLEEPPGAACLILIASFKGRLLPTILSRCQQVPFDPLPTPFVTDRLRAAGVGADDARLLAGLTQGQLGLALRWARADVPQALHDIRPCLEPDAARDVESFGRRLLAVADSLAERLAEPPADAVASDTVEGRGDDASDADDVDEPPPNPEPQPGTRRGAARRGATDQRDGLRVMLALLAAMLREALLRRAAAPPQLAWVAAPEAGPSTLGLDDLRLVDAVQAVAAAERMIDRNVAPQLALERLAAALCGDARAYED
jgi:DNA polymerase III delta' subunit